MITKRMLRVLEAIHNYINEYGYSPTIRELCEILDYCSTSTVFTHLTNLENGGYIERKVASPRAIKITPKGISTMFGGAL